MVCVSVCVRVRVEGGRKSTDADLIYIVTAKMTSATMKSNFWAIQR